MKLNLTADLALLALISPLVREETEENLERETGVPSTQYVTGLSGVIMPELRPLLPGGPGWEGSGSSVSRPSSSMFSSSSALPFFSFFFFRGEKQYF